MSNCENNDFMNFVDKFEDHLINFEKMKDKPIGLFGAGNFAPNAYELLKKDGFNPICFIDNDINKQGSDLLLLPIVSLHDKFLDNIEYIVTTPKNLDKIVIDEISIHKSVISFDKYYILKNFNRFKNIRDNVFKDNLSKITLNNILCAILTYNNSYYAEINTPNQYYVIPEFMEKQNDYFVDIGAFVGDSVERYIWMNCIFKKIWAFEPAKKQYNALVKRTKRLIEEWAFDNDQIIPVNSGIGEVGKTIVIDQEISGKTKPNFSLEIPKKIKKDCEMIKITTIDEYFKNQKVHFLKADIEGMEMSMLKGAKETIKTQMPKLAICTYHNIYDLIDILDYILELVPSKYNFALRHHSSNFYETVLYCWT